MARKSYVVDSDDIDSVGRDDSRRSINLRIDNTKFATLEGLRQSGWGMAQTKRNRSDVYNEALGHGIQVMMMRQEIGEKEFDQIWRLLNKLDVRRINLDAIEKMISNK
jgi:hypothetical protein